MDTSKDYTDYIQDPIELMEMRADRMMEKHFSSEKPGMFLCAICEQWRRESDGMASTSEDPSSPPICGQCMLEDQPVIGQFHIGQYTLTHCTMGGIFITRPDGEGGQFATELLEKAIKDFYDTNF